MLLPQYIVYIQYIIFVFLFCQQRLFLRTIKETKCTLPTTDTVYSAAFITACSHTTKMQKALILIETRYGGCDFGSEEVHFDFKGGATTALEGATIAD